MAAYMKKIASRDAAITPYVFTEVEVISPDTDEVVVAKLITNRLLRVTFTVVVKLAVP
jgi:hypothetical protein